MYNNKSILAVVPARGGSKGLPGKNIKVMNGKPLIQWTLLQALNSKYIDEIHVSTDDQTIADVCEKCGVKIDNLRPKRLAQDNSTAYEVLEYIFDIYNSRLFDYFIMLEPTSPLRKSNDIDDIIELAVQNQESDGVISLGEVHTEHPGLLKRVSDIGYVERLFKDVAENPLRQMNEVVYFPYGVGYMMKREAFLRDKTFYTDKMRPFIIERWQNYEIDDIYDFICIEAIMKERMLKNG